jgi:outer membrane lipoprotein-sorting protein
MKKIMSISILIIACLMICGLAYAFEFSADTVMTTEGHTMNGKMFSKGEKFRMEISTPENMIMITRMDKKVVWNIMPSQKMYMEMPVNPSNAPKTDIKGELERKQVGAEIIDGHPTKKYLVTYKNGAKTEQAYQWMATDINFPVKTADLQNKWVQEFRNIKIGSQPDSLFEPPAGYHKMQMPAGMPMR